MFKQLTFVFVLVLIATAKKHRDGDSGPNCAKTQCPDQFAACKADPECKETVTTCMAALPDDPTEEESDQFETCIKANQPAYDFLDCVISNCSQPQHLNKQQLNTFHKVMKKMH